MATQLSDDEFEQKLNLLGLQSKPMSEMTPEGEETASLEAAPYTPPEPPKAPEAIPAPVSNPSLDAMAEEAKRSKEGHQLQLPELKNVEPESVIKSEDRLQQLLTGKLDPETQADKKMLEDYFGQSQASAPVQPVDEVSQQDPFEKNQDLNDQALKDAQDVARNKTLIANLGEAFGGFAAKASGQQFDRGFYTDLQKQAQQPVEDIKTRKDSLLKGLNAAKIVTDLAIGKLDAGRKKELLDPTSKLNKSLGAVQLYAMRIVNPELADILSKSEEFQNLSGIDKKEYVDHMIETIVKLDANKATKEAVNANKIENYEKQENIKEGVAIRKEDRKLRQELDKSDATLKSTLNNLIEAKKTLEDYSKNSWAGGTGPLATLGGLKSNISQPLEALKSKFNKISLGEMVKTFQGMSKAVDSETERKAWEATQPNITLDDKTNKQLLDDAIEATKRMIVKTNAAKQRYDRSGTFDADVTSPRSPEARGTDTPFQAVPEQDAFPRQVRNGKGQIAFVSNEKELNEAMKEGFK